MYSIYILFTYLYKNKIPNVEGKLFVRVVQAYNIIKSDTFGESDGIVILKVNKGSKQIL